jgi:predicted nucleic acid-binding protein
LLAALKGADANAACLSSPNGELHLRVESALSFGVEATRIYGESRTRLERPGKPIGPLDQMIGADALSENTVLVTNNIREFQRVEGVMLENWAT